MRRPGLACLLSLSSVLICAPLAAQRAQEAAEAEETDEPPVLNVRQLVQRAERSYPGMSAAQARIRAARAQLDEAWVSPFFQSWITAGVSLAPEVRGSPIFSPDPQLPLDNPWQPVLGFSIEGVVPLWTFGKLPAARDAARAGVRAAEADRTRVRQQLRYDVRRAYFGLQLALDLRQMFDEGLPAIREAAERLEAQLAEGDAEVSELDQYRLETALAEIEAREADAIRLEQTARQALVILTGVRRFQIPACPIEPVEYELQPRAHYVRQATGRRPEVRMLEAAVRARQAGLDVAQAGFFPDLALAYRFGTTYAPGITDQGNPFVIDQANYTSIQAGLVLRWSLDLWGNVHRVDRATALLDDTRERAREAARGLELEVSEAYESAQAAQRQVEAWGRGRRSARRWFIAAAQGRDVGTIEPRDLVDAARAYFGARFGHLKAIHDYNAALANLERTSADRLVDAWQPPCE